MIKLLKFNLNNEIVVQNNCELVNKIKTNLFIENENICNLIDFEEDDIFLNPNLIGYFLSNIDSKYRISLIQILLGYFSKKNKNYYCSLSSDIFGLVNLPNLGYLKIEPNSTINISYKEILNKLIPNQFVTNTTIRLCLHPTNHLCYQSGVKFDETIEESTQKSIKEFDKAIFFLQNEANDFWKVIENATREIVIFSSPNHNSFAGIMHQGTAYINIENKRKSVIFFIDDIAHQCGHVIFNILTLDSETYLKIPKDYPLKGFSPNPQESRGVYGAFHGLFTYTLILYSLDLVVQKNNQFKVEEIHEALGRIGFYMQKFNYDLNLMNNSEILTIQGLEFHDQFQKSYEEIYVKYNDRYKSFDYSNQPYVFQYDLFLQINPIKS